MSKKKEEERPANNHMPFESVVLNYSQPRYPLVSQAVSWAKVLKKKQENQYLRTNEILEMALKDVASGKVDQKTIQKELQALLEVQAKPAEEEAQKEKEKEKPKAKAKETVAAGKKKK